MSNVSSARLQPHASKKAPARILVVDDEPANCDLLSRKLQRAGYTTAIAANGELALDEIAASHYDLILLDIMMPQMDGIQALQILRRTRSPEHLPIIMVTAMADSDDVARAIELGANDYVVKPIDFAVLQARIERHLGTKRSSDGKIAETRKLRGIVLNQSASLENEKHERHRAEHELAHAKFCLDNASDAIFGFTEDRLISYVNDAAAALCGYNRDKLLGASIETIYPGIIPDEWANIWQQAKVSGSATIREPIITRGQSYRSTEAIFDYVCVEGDESICAFVRDLTNRESIEAELQQARRLEAIGQLAAGIAHEMNTPLQFVEHNTAFLQAAFTDLSTLADAVQHYLESAKRGAAGAQALAELEAAFEKADLEYLRDEIPRAVDQSLDGIERVTGIVRAMKEFSHPGSNQKQLADLGQIVRSAVIVSTNEWKYVADIDVQLDESLPSIPCHAQELSQVIVNLLVNAAHAIDASAKEPAKLEPAEETKGRIAIQTLLKDASVEVRISDNGCGIPEDIQARIFEPFFTTKEVGKGTGQGLSIAYSTIVDKHGGEFNVESTPGKGTTFVFRLPVCDDSGAAVT